MMSLPVSGPMVRAGCVLWSHGPSWLCVVYPMVHSGGCGPSQGLGLSYSLSRGWVCQGGTRQTSSGSRHTLGSRHPSPRSMHATRSRHTPGSDI